MIRRSACALAAAASLLSGCASGPSPYRSNNAIPFSDPGSRAARASGFLQFLVATMSAGDHLAGEQVTSAEPAPSQALPPLAP